MLTIQICNSQQKLVRWELRVVIVMSEEINGLATGLTMSILELPDIPGVQSIVLAEIRLLIVSRTFPDKCKA